MISEWIELVSGIPKPVQEMIAPELNHPSRTVPGDTIKIKI